MGVVRHGPIIFVKFSALRLHLVASVVILHGEGSWEKQLLSGLLYIQGESGGGIPPEFMCSEISFGGSQEPSNL